MTEYKVQWWGGPLDGCAKTTAFLPTWWQGPDPAIPSELVHYQLVWVSRSKARYVWRPRGAP